MQNIEESDASFSHASPWFIRVGFVDAIYDSSARIALAGHVVPGATANVSNSATLTADVGYDVTRNVSLVLMAGFPPKPDITARGTVAGLDRLGKVRYGPLLLTATYTMHDWGAFQPYVGAGVVYAFMLHPRDGAVEDLGVHNNFGIVLQAGAEYAFDDHWSVYTDFKKVWLSANAEGHLQGDLPVKASVKLNPVLLSTGVKFHFD